jgi:tRNA uridine 5-carbamoylmethylation protein Kti12
LRGSKRPILLLAGAPGSGKTTVAGVLASRFERAVHLESDRFFDFIAAGYIEPWRPESHQQNETVMRILAGAAAGYADAGYFTIVEGIISPAWFLRPMCDSLEELGHRVAYAVLRAPLTLCLTRASNRHEERLSDASVVEQLWHDFSELGALEPHAIDVQTLTAEGVADALARKLRAGLLSA